jgi:hypothetical protein
MTSAYAIRVVASGGTIEAASQRLGNPTRIRVTIEAIES